MSFSLGFSPEFFLSVGEPYDAPTKVSDKPVSVWQAIQSMSDDDWKAMCEDCFPDCDPDMVEPESVLDLIRETDTCTDLTPPVEVWIDSEGHHTVKVWDDTRGNKPYP